MIRSHGLTNEARELCCKVVKVASHAFPVTSDIWIDLVRTTAIARAFPTTFGRLRSRCITLPRQTSSTPFLITGVGHLTLDAHPRREVWRSRTSYALTTSPTIAFSTSGLVGRYGYPTARPVLSPIDTIITIVFFSRPQCPAALAPASSPVVTTSAARFFRRYLVATFACPGLTIILRVLGRSFTVWFTSTSPPLWIS